jgi:hypothetical protein
MKENPRKIEIETKSAAPKRGAWKVMRVAKRKAHYAAQPMKTIANKQRALAHHLRYFPEDSAARAVYGKRYGVGALESPRVAPVARAVRRATRRKRAAILAARLVNEANA